MSKATSLMLKGRIHGVESRMTVGGIYKGGIFELLGQAFVVLKRTINRVFKRESFTRTFKVKLP